MNTNERGFTLVEILVATSVIAVAFAAIGLGLMQATTGVETGRQQTTAVFLAEQRLERIKAFSLSTQTGQGFANVVNGGSACCSTEAFNTITGYGNYQRTVTVTNVNANNRIVRVTVSYVPIAPGAGAQTNQRQVSLSTWITNR